MQPLLRHLLAVITRMEELVKRSGLDWTVGRPSRFTNEPWTGRYRTAVDHHLTVTDSMVLRVVVSVAY